MADYLYLWDVPTEDRFDHACSSQLKTVQKGDVLWIVFNKGMNEFSLIGRLQVGWSGKSATEALKRIPDRKNLFREASWYVTVEPETYQDVTDLNIFSIAAQLRFISTRNANSLEIRNGNITAGQLRQKRRLTAESVQLLNRIWYVQEILPVNALEFLETTEDEHTFQEGRLILRTRHERERSSKLIQEAKRLFKKRYKRLYCEVCGFDFTERYGALGDGYIEAHHRIPISQFEELHEAQLSDLVMLCANCHRMIHKLNPPLTVEELKEKLFQE